MPHGWVGGVLSRLVLCDYKSSEISDDQLFAQTSSLNSHCLLLQNHGPLTQGVRERCPLDEAFRSLCYSNRQGGPTILQVHSSPQPHLLRKPHLPLRVTSSDHLLNSTRLWHPGQGRLDQWGQPISRQAWKPKESGCASSACQGFLCRCWSVASAVSDSVQPCRLQPTRLLCPWDSLGKSTRVDC